MAPMMAASARPRLTGEPNSTTGRTKTGRASRPPMPEEREGGQAADGIGGVHPAHGQHPELHGGTGRRPSRHDEGDGVAGQLGGDHREPRLGPQGDALEGEGAGEVGHLGHEGRDEPQAGRAWPAWATSGTRSNSSGSTR